MADRKTDTYYDTTLMEVGDTTMTPEMVDAIMDYYQQHLIISESESGDDDTEDRETISKHGAQAKFFSNWAGLAFYVCSARLVLYLLMPFRDQ